MMKYIISLLLVFTFSVGFAQTEQKKLENKKQQLQREINENQRKLRDIGTKQKDLRQKIEAQNKQIRLKEDLIRTTESQLKLINDDLYRTQLQINQLNRDLEKLKEDYANTIVSSYKSRSTQSRVMFLLSSENFLQAYKRAQYMKQYANFRKQQGEELKEKTAKLEEYTASIAVKKAEQQKVYEENNKERSSLIKEKHDQEVLVNSLKKDSNKIAAEIKKKQQESRKIDQQIDRLIQKAIQEANRKAAAAAAKKNAATSSNKSDKGKSTPKTTVSSTRITLTPEMKIVADNFKANQGRLPWPVERGAITLGYGDQPHPVHRYLTIHNSGVEITTTGGAEARAVFGGEVLNVLKISPNNMVVIIQHGDYFTIYQNLATVSVSQGQKVGIKQSLGRVRTNSEEKTVLKFLIKQNNAYVNPKSWLSN